MKKKQNTIVHQMNDLHISLVEEEISEDVIIE